MLSRPIVLLSDFGLKDHYCGVLKGVILSNNPKAQIIDLTHEVESYNIQSGCYILMSSYKYFPKGSIFLAIIDPEVGNQRDILLIKTDKYYFLAPNNGILSFIDKSEIKKIYKVKMNHKDFTRESNTFHGRDIFAILAAKLSLGNYEEYLEEFKSEIKEIDLGIVEDDGKLIGKVIYIDKFGNLITSIKNELFEIIEYLEIKELSIKEKAANYSKMQNQTPTIYKGSSGFIEIGTNQINTSKKFDINLNIEIKITYIL